MENTHIKTSSKLLTPEEDNEKFPKQIQKFSSYKDNSLLNKFQLIDPKIS